MNNDDMNCEHEVIGRTTKFEGEILRVESWKIRVKSDGKVIEREIVVHKPAVAVLVRRVDGMFILVSQRRFGANQRLDEIVAGGINDGESEVEAAIRETHEETGYVPIADPIYLTTITPIPGYCTEVVHVYFAEVPLVQIGQNLDEDEYVKPVAYTEDELEALICRGRIKDAKTIAAWHLYRRYRADFGREQIVAPMAKQGDVNQSLTYDYGIHPPKGTYSMKTPNESSANKLATQNQSSADKKLDFVMKMHGRLMDLRNIEVNQIWPRAVFLGTIIVVLYTGYGWLVLHDNLPSLRICALKSAVCVVGCWIAFVWALTFRGSKSWIENYQSALGRYVDTFFNDEYLGSMAPHWKSLCGKLVQRSYLQLNGKRTNNRIISLEGGIFSLSKILVLMGWIQLMTWFVLLSGGTVVDWCRLNGPCLRVMFQLIALLVAVVGLIIILKNLKGSQWGRVDGFYSEGLSEIS